MPVAPSYLNPTSKLVGSGKEVPSTFAARGAHRVPIIRAFYDLDLKLPVHNCTMLRPHWYHLKRSKGNRRRAGTRWAKRARFQNSRALGAELGAFQHCTWGNKICPRPSEVHHFQCLPFREGKSSSLLTPATLPDTISLDEIVTVSDNLVMCVIVKNDLPSGRTPSTKPH